jgi:hypothetical protein
MTRIRIIDFLEKPKNPPAMPGKPDVALASMGIYVFKTKFLLDELNARRVNDRAAPAAISARISSRIWSSTAKLTPITFRARVSARARKGHPTGATSGRLMPTGRPISI